MSFEIFVKGISGPDFEIMWDKGIAKNNSNKNKRMRILKNSSNDNSTTLMMGRPNSIKHVRAVQQKE